MTALIFVGAIIWGALSGQFLVQTVTSLTIALVYLVAIFFSNVPRGMNGVGSIVSLVQSIVFAALLVAGNWLASGYIGFGSWNAASIAFIVSAAATALLVARQVPGKILLARVSAWSPLFAQVMMHRPRHERVELARKFRASPTLETLYPRTTSTASSSGEDLRIS
jgi:hypothetical protein